MKKIIFTIILLIFSNFVFSDYFNFLTPGLNASVLIGLDSKNVYYGGGFHAAILSILISKADESNISQNNAFSPACYEWFVEVNLFKGGDQIRMDNYMFNYLTGISISFDRAESLSREYFIPYYGIKAGGIYFNSNNEDYSGFVVEPLLGLSFVRTKNILFNFDVSVMLSSLKFREFLSVRPNLVFCFVF